MGHARLYVSMLTPVIGAASIPQPALTVTGARAHRSAGAITNPLLSERTSDRMVTDALAVVAVLSIDRGDRQRWLRADGRLTPPRHRL